MGHALKQLVSVSERPCSKTVGVCLWKAMLYNSWCLSLKGHALKQLVSVSERPCSKTVGVCF